MVKQSEEVEEDVEKEEEEEEEEWVSRALRAAPLCCVSEASNRPRHSALTFAATPEGNTYTLQLILCLAAEQVGYHNQMEDVLP
ncbi:hypothetical protein EYF80_016152 [Liparis tanakae]|uniref:Uncharacterized protein n=1 Tax=Liparis tanakae TaxID=230148 RepID=A0A4Z2I693_9TELE|nr:hypothetical protein EYF80_016152 [Liparis tanakae]